MVLSVNQHLLGRSNFNIKARYAKKLNAWVTCCWVWSKIQFYGFGTCYLMTIFWFMPWLFFRVIHVQGSHFHVKNVIKWTGGRGSTRLHKAALQRAGFFVPFWSVNGCKFPPLWSETENGSQENHKCFLKHFCLKITMFRNSILVRCHQQIWVIFMISWSKFPRGAWPVRSTTRIWIVKRLPLRSFIPSPILVPRAPWGPEYEDQEALGTQDLKS